MERDERVSSPREETREGGGGGVAPLRSWLDPRLPPFPTDFSVAPLHGGGRVSHASPASGNLGPVRAVRRNLKLVRRVR